MVPMLVARSASSAADVGAVVTRMSIPVVVLCMVVFGWVRFRADLHAAMADATGGGSR